MDHFLEALADTQLFEDSHIIKADPSHPDFNTAASTADPSEAFLNTDPFDTATLDALDAVPVTSNSVKPDLELDPFDASVLLPSLDPPGSGSRSLTPSPPPPHRQHHHQHLQHHSHTQMQNNDLAQQENRPANPQRSPQPNHSQHPMHLNFHHGASHQISNHPQYVTGANNIASSVSHSPHVSSLSHSLPHTLPISSPLLTSHSNHTGVNGIPHHTVPSPPVVAMSPSPPTLPLSASHMSKGSVSMSPSPSPALKHLALNGRNPVPPGMPLKPAKNTMMSTSPSPSPMSPSPPLPLTATDSNRPLHPQQQQQLLHQGSKADFPSKNAMSDQNTPEGSTVSGAPSPAAVQTPTSGSSGVSKDAGLHMPSADTHSRITAVRGPLSQRVMEQQRLQQQRLQQQQLAQAREQEQKKSQHLAEQPNQMVRAKQQPTLVEAGNTTNAMKPGARPTPTVAAPTGPVAVIKNEDARAKDKLAQRKLRNKESARRYREKQVARRKHLEHYTKTLSEQNRELESLHDRLLSLTCERRIPLSGVGLPVAGSAAQGMLGPGARPTHGTAGGSIASCRDQRAAAAAAAAAATAANGAGRQAGVQM